MATSMHFPLPREHVLTSGNTIIGVIPALSLVSHFQVSSWQVLYRPIEMGNIERWGLPLMVWILVAVMVWLEAPISGTSLNPARSFGPALVSWSWHYHWLYWVAPPLGASLAVGAFRLLSGGARDVLTGKLFHVSHYRSVFMNVSAPHIPADGRLRKKA
jgi:hypothetical protein